MLYCRVLPLAGIVDAACTRIIAGATQHQDIIAQHEDGFRAISFPEGELRKFILARLPQARHPRLIARLDTP
jgi:hypothetical protein